MPEIGNCFFASVCPKRIKQFSYLKRANTYNFTQICLSVRIYIEVEMLTIYTQRLYIFISFHIDTFATKPARNRLHWDYLHQSDNRSFVCFHIISRTIQLILLMIVCPTLIEIRYYSVSCLIVLSTVPITQVSNSCNTIKHIKVNIAQPNSNAILSCKQNLHTIATVLIKRYLYS